MSDNWEEIMNAVSQCQNQKNKWKFVFMEMKNLWKMNEKHMNNLKKKARQTGRMKARYENQTSCLKACYENQTSCMKARYEKELLDLNTKLRKMRDALNDVTNHKNDMVNIASNLQMKLECSKRQQQIAHNAQEDLQAKMMQQQQIARKAQEDLQATMKQPQLILQQLQDKLKCRELQLEQQQLILQQLQDKLKCRELQLEQQQLIARKAQEDLQAHVKKHHAKNEDVRNLLLKEREMKARANALNNHALTRRNHMPDLTNWYMQSNESKTTLASLKNLADDEQNKDLIVGTLQSLNVTVSKDHDFSYLVEVIQCMETRFYNSSSSS